MTPLEYFKDILERQPDNINEYDILSLIEEWKNVTFIYRVVWKDKRTWRNVSEWLYTSKEEGQQAYETAVKNYLTLTYGFENDLDFDINKLDFNSDTFITFWKNEIKQNYIYSSSSSIPLKNWE